ncbi:MAG: signal recognition particle-docking protein FtsY [Bdellovibrionaceae bacterium]|nr:signal recognition particle-docking protein FtsY [Pseudobdellovibrionaceae bacterium]MDW8190413.1 signal recognition particle-docking protein FtsY [Pseudobdellovibrionaceae bacterium]
MISVTEHWLLVGIVAVFIVIFLLMLIPILRSSFSLKNNNSSSSAVVLEREPSDYIDVGSPSRTEKPKKETMGLSKTQEFFKAVLHKFVNTADETRFEHLEQELYLGDLGPKVVEHLISVLQKLPISQQQSLETIKSVLARELLGMLSGAVAGAQVQDFQTDGENPYVCLVVGINGVGKTTTIGKLAYAARKAGRKVLVAAGDTFRAAAAEQLSVWSQRAHVDFFSPPQVKDPAAVAFQAVEKAKREGYDYLLIDTAGRLHGSHNLMEELKKIYRSVTKALGKNPHQVFVVLDASGGQNGIIQVQKFKETIPVTGVILTKMDGSSKGGMAVHIVNDLKIPVLWLGVGESIEDLVPFDSNRFVRSLLGGVDSVSPS